MSKEKKYKHGFKTPEDYFENLEERLFTNLNSEQLPEKSGFGVPQGYFDTLEEKVMEKVKLEAQPKVVSIFRRKTFIYAASIAACAALVFTLYTPSTITGDDIQLSEIEEYIESDQLDLDTYDIAQLLTDDDIEGLTLDEELFSEETLETYLLENIDDTSLLIE
ncbi:MAG: hypothetical protein HKN48_09835 [Flavobacteriaceae bacterium]|nr:hypothetical protein [Flavobacteriaceae bacterium]